MIKTVIKVDNISKRYQLEQFGSNTFAQDFNRWWRVKILQKKETFLDYKEDLQNSSKNYIWALKNINFEMKKGDILGIIGLNGSGKSTLLKILSNIVAPTTGSIIIKGRIISLLEIGTGFHPEMTGRENLYLNGAIMGMKKAEINDVIEKIIEFSEIKRFIDVPVKRYSSGMYMRLAFSIAVHLQADIMIFDEVFAVGDIKFQEKCISKILKCVRDEERTVIFVSHNLKSVISICNKAIYLKNGEIVKQGKPKEVAGFYLAEK